MRQPGAGVADAAAPGILIAPAPDPRRGRRPRRSSADRRGLRLRWSDLAQRDPRPRRSASRPSWAWGETLLGVADGTELMLDGEAGTVTVDPPAGASAGGRGAAGRAGPGGRRGRCAKATLPAADPRRPRRAGGGQRVGAGRRRAGAGRRRRRRRPAAHRVPVPRPRTTCQAKTSRSRPTGRSPRASAAARSSCARSTSAPTSRSPTCRSPPSRIRFSALRGIRLGLQPPELLRSPAAGRPARGRRPSAARPAARWWRPSTRCAGRARALASRRGDAGRGCTTPPAPPRRASSSASWSRCRPPPCSSRTSRRTSTSSRWARTTWPSTSLAAERGNAAVAALADALHPAVLRLIERVARVAGAARSPGRGVRRGGRRPSRHPDPARSGGRRALDGPATDRGRQTGRCGPPSSARPGGSPSAALAAGSAAEVRRLAAESAAGTRPAAGSLVPGDGPDR